MFAIETEKLHKSYDGLPVLRGLDLRVPDGQVYGILGPNGAGKSTLMHVLLGFLKPTRGSVRVLGERNLERTRGRVGYLPERLRYHLRYSGREYLRYLGQFSDLPQPLLTARVEEGLRTVGLHEAADRLLSSYSKGMLQRLGIAQALLTDPEILMIDEPTAGLDPAGQREMLDLLAKVRDRGHTIFLATHVLEEVEQLCDLVGVLFGGKLAAEIEVRSLRTPGRSVLISVGELPVAVAQRLEALAPAVRCGRGEVALQPNTPALQAQVLRALIDAEVPIIALEPQSRPLEELYLRVVSGEPIAPPPDEPPPDGLFAPPGHPDALPAPPGRPSTGDTLLRKLLGQESERDHKPDSKQDL